MFEELQVISHSFLVENCVDRRVDLVFKGENVPTDFAMRILKHTSV
jgi:hypothetical protein